MKPPSRKKRPPTTHNQYTELTETIENAEGVEIMSPEELLRQHLGDDDDDKVFKCNVCHKQFKKKDYLRRHQETHTLDLHQCRLCNSWHKSFRLLQTHTNLKHTEKRRELKCRYCVRRFRFECERREHERVHTGEKPHKCTECEKSFRALYSLQTHMLIHTGEKPFACKHCPYRCRDSSTLRKHQERHLGRRVEHPCGHCDKTFAHKMSLEAHVAQDHLGRDSRLACLECGRTYRTKTTLKNHVDRVHKRMHSGHCEICNKYIPNLGNLKQHMLRHTDDRPFECSFEGCGKRFKTSQDVSRHAKLHNPDEHYECNECQRKFSRKNRLARHIRTVHEKKRRFECNECGVRFYGINYLARHLLKKHAAPRRLACDACGLQTSSKSLLARHLRGHEDDADLYCKICKNNFRYKDFAYLKNHYLRTHRMRYKPGHAKGKRIGKRHTIKEEDPILKDEAPESPQVTVVKEEIFDEEETVIQAINMAEEITQPITFKEEEVMSHNSESVVSEDLAKSPEISAEVEKELETRNFDQFLTRNLVKTTDRVNNEADKQALIFQQSVSDVSKDLAKSVEEVSLEKELDSDINANNETASTSRQDTNKDATNTKSVISEDLAKSLDDIGPEKELESDSFDEVISRNTRGKKTRYRPVKETRLRRTLPDGRTLGQKETEERKLRKENKRQQALEEREAMAGVREEYNRRVMEIANKMADEELSESGKKESSCLEKEEDVIKSVQKNSIESDKQESIDNEPSCGDNASLKMTIKDGKVQFNKVQCYVCFKLFDTKQKLIDHCAEHFDLCSVTMLRKCPLCDYASSTNFSRHLERAHDLAIRVHSGGGVTEENGKFSKKLIYSSKEEVTTVEVIPSIKNLNHRCVMKIDAERRNLKRKGTLKDNLVKKGKEWVIEKQLQKIEYEKFLLPVDGALNVNVKTLELDYLEKMTRLNNLAKKEGYKILYPCDKCDQVCTGLAALKAHYNIHNPRPKRKRTNHPLTLAKKNTNKKSNAELKSFFEKHIKGSELDFFEFSKAFESVDRNDLEEMD